MLILPNDEGLIDFLHRFESIEMIGDDIAECVFQTICGNLGSVVIGNGIEMIVCHIDGLQGVFMENFDDFRGMGNHLECVFFSGFLFFIVAMQEVDDMSKSGCGNVVEQGCNALLYVVCEMPYDESYTNAVLIACVAANVAKTWKVGVFASAIHTNTIKTLQGRGSCNALDEGRNGGMIDWKPPPVLPEGRRIPSGWM